MVTGCSKGSDDHDHDHDHEGHSHGEETGGGKEAHDHEGALIIEPERATELGITIEELKPGEFSEVIKVGGRIEPASTDMVTVTARKSGIVTLAQGITVGMKVGAGSTIATISPKGMEGGDTNAAAKATIEAARKEVERLKPLYEEGLVTASVYNEAERLYNESMALAATSPQGGPQSESSPSAGTISQIFVTSGQYVEAGAPIALIAKSSRLSLKADVPGRYASVLPSIKTANFRPDYSNQVYSIAALGGSLLSGNHSVDEYGFIPLYFSFNSVAGTLPGAFAEVYLIGSPKGGALTVPADAIIELQGNKYVYEVHDGHAYEKKLVKTGGNDGQRVEILEGLTAGEKIVTSGATIVRMEETSAIAPPGHTHNH